MCAACMCAGCCVCLYVCMFVRVGVCPSVSGRRAHYRTHTIKIASRERFSEILPHKRLPHPQRAAPRPDRRARPPAWHKRTRKRCPGPSQPWRLAPSCSTRSGVGSIRNTAGLQSATPQGCNPQHCRVATQTLAARRRRPAPGSYAVTDLTVGSELGTAQQPCSSPSSAGIQQDAQHSP